MNDSDDMTKDRDMKTLVDIAKGPGYFATPSPERVERLMRRGLVIKTKGTLRPTLKGRLMAWLFK